jgi:hypothetical protein
MLLVGMLIDGLLTENEAKAHGKRKMSDERQRGRH